MVGVEVRWDEATLVGQGVEVTMHHRDQRSVRSAGIIVGASHEEEMSLLTQVANGCAAQFVEQEKRWFDKG